MNTVIIQKAFDWVNRESGEGFLSDQDYCATRDAFHARLEHLRHELETIHLHNASLLLAIIGEIGNNAYDHNLGNWRDVPGIYFTSSDDRKTLVIADRGQGIRTTIARVKPDVTNDQDALRVAFTEAVSGRSPEQRGNGLKFVRSIVAQQRWRLACYSGSAIIKITDTLYFEEYQNDIKGSIFIITL